MKKLIVTSVCASIALAVSLSAQSSLNTRYYASIKSNEKKISYLNDEIKFVDGRIKTATQAIADIEKKLAEVKTKIEIIKKSKTQPTPVSQDDLKKYKTKVSPPSVPSKEKSETEDKSGSTYEYDKKLDSDTVQLQKKLIEEWNKNQKVLNEAWNLNSLNHQQTMLNLDKTRNENIKKANEERKKEYEAELKKLAQSLKTALKVNGSASTPATSPQVSGDQGSSGLGSSNVGSGSDGSNASTATENIDELLAQAKQAVAQIEKEQVSSGEGKKVKDSLSNSIPTALTQNAQVNDSINTLATVGALGASDTEAKSVASSAANDISTAILDNRKSTISGENLSTMAVQVNNMTKRLGEVRGLGEEAGVWFRGYGGQMSVKANGVKDKFNYTSVQLGADKISDFDWADNLLVGLLVGFDNVSSSIDTKSYSLGTYASVFSDYGFFADGVAKYVSTKHSKSGYKIDNQSSFLLSLEGGYRQDLNNGYYVEPSLELITGRIGEFKSVKAVSGLTNGSAMIVKVNSFSPVLLKPQLFVGAELDGFKARFGGGAIIDTKASKASFVFKNIIAGIDGNASTTLDKASQLFISAGSSYDVNKNLRLNFGIEKSFGKSLQNEYEINFNARYGF